MTQQPTAPAVVYVVRINSGEPEERQSENLAAKFVAENILTGRDADVVFLNAIAAEVRRSFERLIDHWLRERFHTSGFYCEPTETGMHYRLHE